MKNNGNSLNNQGAESEVLDLGLPKDPLTIPDEEIEQDIVKGFISTTNAVQIPNHSIEVVHTGRGRKKGSKNKPKDPIAQQNKQVIQEQNQINNSVLIPAMTMVADTTFSIIARLTKEDKWKLTSEESEQLGKAIIPVLDKYGEGWFTQYAAEANLGLVLLGIAAVRFSPNISVRNEGTGKNNSTKEVVNSPPETVS